MLSKGAFTTLHHNETCDIYQPPLRGVCPNTCIEPGLQPLSGDAHSQYGPRGMGRHKSEMFPNFKWHYWHRRGLTWKIYKVASCLCLLVYSQCIITFIVHTVVAIVVVNMQCIHVVPALPANEVSTANKDAVSHVHLYVSAASVILNFSGLLWHVVNSRLSNSENLTSVSNRRTELALPHWKDWIFTSFEDKYSNLRVHCNSL